MSSASPVLPENPAELRAFAIALQARNQVLEDELYAKTLHIEQLKMQLGWEGPTVRNCTVRNVNADRIPAIWPPRWSVRF